MAPHSRAGRTRGWLARARCGGGRRGRAPRPVHVRQQNLLLRVSLSSRLSRSSRRSPLTVACAPNPMKIFDQISDRKFGQKVQPKICRKILWKIFDRKFDRKFERKFGRKVRPRICRKILWKILHEKLCRKICMKNLHEKMLISSVTPPHNF